MPAACNLLLADMEDILQVVVPIIFVILSGLGSLLGGRDKAKGAKPKVRGQQAGRRPAAPGAGPAGPPQDALRREVEDFLRKARGEAPQPQKQLRRPAQQKPADRPPARRGTAQPVEPVQRSRPPLRDTSTGSGGQRPQQPRRLAEPARETVAQHVQSHIAENPVTEHATHLAEQIGLADERMEEHLRERFSHKLGTLSQSVDATAVVEAPSPMIAELIGTLTRPGGARQLVLANEILRRPEDRWTREN